MFTILLVIQTLVAAGLVGVILMQRSEGGGLGVGGSSSGLMTARAAADFLTRATAVLATLFILLSIALAALATVERAPSTVNTRLQRDTPVTSQPAQPIAPAADPLANIAGPPANGVTNSTVPLAQ